MTNVLFNIIMSLGAAMGTPFTVAYANGSRSVLALTPETTPLANKASADNTSTSFATSPISMVYGELANQLHNAAQEQLEINTSAAPTAAAEVKLPETAFDGEQLIDAARENAKSFSWKNVFKSIAMSSNIATTPVSAVFMAEIAERGTKNAESVIANATEQAHNYGFLDAMAKLFAGATTTPVSAVLMAEQNERMGRNENATEAAGLMTAFANLFAGATTTPVSAVLMAEQNERINAKNGNVEAATKSTNIITALVDLLASAPTTPASAVLMAEHNERINAKNGNVEAATKSTNIITALVDLLASATTTPASAVLMAEHNERMGRNEAANEPAGLMTAFANIFAGATTTPVSAVFMAEIAAKNSNDEEKAVALIIANISESKANKVDVSAPNYDAATEERIAKTWDCIWQKMCSDIDLNALNEEVFTQAPASNKAPFERFYKAA